MRTLWGIAIVAGFGAMVGACDVTVTRDDDQPDVEVEAPDPTEEIAEAETAAPDEIDTGSETGLEEDDELDQPVRTASSTRRAEIDWEAARTDLASRGESDETFNIQSGSSAPPVPVLLPTGPARPASTSGGPQPQFRSLSDGYFAVFPGDEYNLTVNGTNEVTDVPGIENAETENMIYSETTTGAIVSFSRYGADYLVEFECLGSGEEGGSCISEDEARSVAEDIVISGTQ